MKPWNTQYKSIQASRPAEFRVDWTRCRAYVLRTVRVRARNVGPVFFQARTNIGNDLWTAEIIGEVIASDVRTNQERIPRSLIPAHYLEAHWAGFAVLARCRGAFIGYGAARQS